MVPDATDNDLLHAANPGDAAGAGHPADTMGRLDTAGDIADGVAMLDRPDARRFTRQVINTTGGLAELPSRPSSGREQK